MKNENVSISRYELDYMYNLINSMRNEIIAKDEEKIKLREFEKLQEPICYGCLTTYKRQDGSLFQKRTKHRPINYCGSTTDDTFYYKVGDVNSFGHEIISIVEDMQLNLGLDDIDINKKWYVD